MIIGRSFVGFGFALFGLSRDLSRSRDLDLLYDLLCLSRSRSRSLSLDFTLSRSTDLRTEKTEYLQMLTTGNDKLIERKSFLDIPPSSLSRPSSPSISVAITFSGSIPPSSW